MKGVFPATKEHAAQILEIVKARVPDVETNGKKTSLDILAQSYKIAISKPDSPLFDSDVKGSP